MANPAISVFSVAKLVVRVRTPTMCEGTGTICKSLYILPLTDPIDMRN